MANVCDSKRRYCAIAASILVAACGGSVASDDGGADAAVADAIDGWTQCESPDNQRVCAGPNACPQGGACIGCLLGTSPQPGTLGYCASDSNNLEQCAYAEDGLVCVQTDPYPTVADSSWWGAPYNLAVLFANNGATERARYADYGLWTGEALPTPLTCPTLTHAQICGGNCGACNANEVCHGRSPLHPYGFCVPLTISDVCNMFTGKLCTDVSNKCFAYSVQPEAQQLATSSSICLPADMCNDLAANLPGGAMCQ